MKYIKYLTASLNYRLNRNSDMFVTIHIFQWNSVMNSILFFSKDFQLLNHQHYHNDFSQISNVLDFRNLQRRDQVIGSPCPLAQVVGPRCIFRYAVVTRELLVAIFPVFNQQSAPPTATLNMQLLGLCRSSGSLAELLISDPISQ